MLLTFSTHPLNLASTLSLLFSSFLSFFFFIAFPVRSLVSSLVCGLVSKRIFFNLTQYSLGSSMSPMGCCTTWTTSLDDTKGSRERSFLPRDDVVLTIGEATSGNSGRPLCRSYSECISGNRLSPESASMFSYLLMTRHVKVTTRWTSDELDDISVGTVDLCGQLLFDESFTRSQEYVRPQDRFSCCKLNCRLFMYKSLRVCVCVF